jgi:hypothetical protein
MMEVRPPAEVFSCIHVGENGPCFILASEYLLCTNAGFPRCILLCPVNDPKARGTAVLDRAPQEEISKSTSKATALVERGARNHNKRMVTSMGATNVLGADDTTGIMEGMLCFFSTMVHAATRWDARVAVPTKQWQIQREALSNMAVTNEFHVACLFRSRVQQFVILLRTRQMVKALYTIREIKAPTQSQRAFCGQGGTCLLLPRRSVTIAIVFVFQAEIR